MPVIIITIMINQLCPLEIGSFGFDASEMTYRSNILNFNYSIRQILQFPNT